MIKQNRNGQIQVIFSSELQASSVFSSVRVFLVSLLSGISPTITVLLHDNKRSRETTENVISTARNFSLCAVDKVEKVSQSVSMTSMSVEANAFSS